MVNDTKYLKKPVNISCTFFIHKGLVSTFYHHIYQRRLHAKKSSKGLKRICYPTNHSVS